MHKTMQMSPSIGMWIALAMVAALGGGAGCAGSGPAPDQPGPWGVGHSSFSITDSSRGGRTLPVDAWYPVDMKDATGTRARYGLPMPVTASLGLTSSSAITGTAFEGAAAANQRFPLVVVSHGDGGSRLDYYYLTEALATHGFLVVAPDHAGDTVLESLSHTMVTQAQTLADRPLDVSFLITNMLARGSDPVDRFFGRIDPDRIGVTGHSYGGYTTLVMGSGAGSFQPDARVKALLPIDPFANLFTQAQLGSVHVPTFYFSGTRSDLHDTVVAKFGLTSAPQVYLADVQGAAHQNFSWLCPLSQALVGAGFPQAGLTPTLGPAYAQSCQPPAISSADAFRLTILYTVAFFRSTLNSESFYNEYLDPAWTQTNQPLVRFQKHGTAN